MNIELAKGLAYLLVLTAALFGVYQITKRGDERFLNAAIANCESAKRVLAATSVKSDVKEDFTVVKPTPLLVGRFGPELERLGGSLVHQHKRVLDRDAVLEAQGEL